MLVSFLFFLCNYRMTINLIQCIINSALMQQWKQILFSGLDASKYHVNIREAEDDDDKLLNPSSLFDDKDRFKNCHKLKLRCPVNKCGNEILIEDTFKNEVCIYFIPIVKFVNFNYEVFYIVLFLCELLEIFSIYRVIEKSQKK